MKSGIFKFLLTGACALVLSVSTFGAESTRTTGDGKRDAGTAVADRSSNAQAGLSNYKLGSGDVVTIRVFGEDELSRERIRLTDAGTVPYPVLGEVRVKGMTVGDLERMITDGLRGKYLKNPRVAVLIDEYRPFYINGMVASPGGYQWQPGLTVLKAAALAGGFKERADKDKIFVIRAEDPQGQAALVKTGDMVQPGDILTVKESFF